MTTFLHDRNAVSRLYGAPSHFRQPTMSARAARLRAQNRKALWRLAALVSALVVLSSVQSGCASKAAGPTVIAQDYEQWAKRDLDHGESAAVPVARVLESSPSAGGQTWRGAQPGPPTGAESRTLAQQSQSDVEMLLKTGTQSAQRTAAPASTFGFEASHAESASDSPEIGASDIIIWNEPDTARAQASERPSPHTTIVAQHASSSGAPDQPAPAASDPSSPLPETASSQPETALPQFAVNLSRELYAAAAYSDHPLRELTAISALMLVDAERRIEPSVIPDLTDEEREVLASLQGFFADLGEAFKSGTGAAPAVADAAQKLRQAVAHEPELQLPIALLCTKVEGFGDYTTFDRSAFVAGTEQKAIVYLEIAGFVSEVNQNNEFVTDLSQQLTLYSERDGIPVWKEDWQPATDVSRNKRQDFFTVQVITIPRTLSAGRYSLKVRMRDEKSKAEAETSLPIELVADARMLAN